MPYWLLASICSGKVSEKDLVQLRHMNILNVFKTLISGNSFYHRYYKTLLVKVSELKPTPKIGTQSAPSEQSFKLVESYLGLIATETGFPGLFVFLWVAILI